jgi:hypothetical protein
MVPAEVRRSHSARKIIRSLGVADASCPSSWIRADWVYLVSIVTDRGPSGTLCSTSSQIRGQFWDYLLSIVADPGSSGTIGSRSSRVWNYLFLAILDQGLSGTICSPSSRIQDDLRSLCSITLWTDELPLTRIKRLRCQLANMRVLFVR